MSAPSPQPGGRVVALRGPVIDVAFEPGLLPRIDEALRVERDQPGSPSESGRAAGPLIAEVQSHLDHATVRATTAGRIGAGDWRTDDDAGRRGGARPFAQRAG